MADNLVISTSCTGLASVDQTIANVKKSVQIVNSLVGSIGGQCKYAYNVAESVLYQGIVWKATDTTTTWTDSTEVDGTATPYGDGNNTVGSITKIKGIGVKVKSAIGTAANVKIGIKSQNDTGGLTLCTLTVGDGVFIPFEEGIPVNDIYMKANTYDDGVDEITIDLVIIGD